MPHYKPDIGGVFLDSGEAFEVCRVAFAEIGTKRLVARYTKRFGEGAIVEVYVSPTEPDKVVLISDLTLTHRYLLEAPGGLLILLALILLLESRKMSR